MDSGALIEPEWFALHDSRGLDVSGLKTFMRATVAASEYAVYIPAVVIFVRVYGGQAVTSKYERVWPPSGVTVYADSPRQ